MGSVWLWILALTVVLGASSIGVSGEDDTEGKSANGKVVDCTKSENQIIDLKSPAEYAYINCQSNSKWNLLKVTVTSSQTNATLSLNFKDLHNFSPGDTFTIYANVSGTEQKIHEEKITEPRQKIWMPTGQSSLRIEIVQTDGKGDVSIEVRQTCGGTWGGTRFNSPLVPNLGKEASLGSATCSFKVTEMSLYEFDTFKVVDGSKLLFVSGVDKSFTEPMTSLPGHVIIGGKNTEFSITLNLLDPNQNISFALTQLAGASCGKTPVIQLKDADVSISTEHDSTARNGPDMCVWLVEVDEGKKIRLTIDQHTLKYPSDIISVIDSGDMKGTPLIQVTATTASKPVTAVSSGKYIVVAMNSANFQDNEELVKMTASPLSSGGHMTGDGFMTFTEKSDYFLSCRNNESVTVSLGGFPGLDAGQTIAIYADFSSTTPFITFNKDRTQFDVSSPNSELRVQATGFKKPVNVTFTTIERGTGCFRSFVAVQETMVRMKGTCEGTCIWVIRPDVPDPKNTAVFFNILPNNVRNASISHLTDGGGAVRFSDSSDPFMISYAADTGIKMVFPASQNLEMSYTAKLKSPIEVAAPAGCNFTLMSPFFPGIYPMGAEFWYDIELGNKPADLYFASFEAMDLAPGDTLALANGSLQYTGSKLPKDELLSLDKFARVNLRTIGAFNKTNPKGSNGFRVNLAPTAEGSRAISNPRDANKIYTLDGKTCKNLRCVYVINLPLDSKDKTTGVAVNLTVTLPPNKTLTDGDLLVWDGESALRSELIAPAANLSKGGHFASTHNQVIIVYKGSESLNISFTKIDCAFELPSPDGKSNGTYTMCKSDRICMRPGWRCDDKSDCSDGTDEFYCHGRAPTPYPGPRPGSSGWKTAFWLCLPVFVLLGVLLTKGVPVAMQRFRESRYHQFHDLGDH